MEVGFALFILDFLNNLQEHFDFGMRQLQNVYNIRRPELGIGLSRGSAWRALATELQSLDYIGEAIAVAARLKDMARPSGLIAELAFAPGVFMERCCAHEGHISREVLPGKNRTITVWKVQKLQRRRRIIPNRLAKALSLLDNYHDAGEGVSLLREDDTLMMFEAREALESRFAAELARRVKDGKVTRAMMRVLINTTSEMRSMLNDGSIPDEFPSERWTPPVKWSQLGVRFHAEIARLSDANEAKDRQRFTEEIYRFTRQSYSAATTRSELDRVVSQHEDILAAILAGHDHDASASMVSHLGGHYEREREALLKAPILSAEPKLQVNRKAQESFDPNASIADIARKGISLVGDSTLREALSAAYGSARGQMAVETAQRFFKRLINSAWPIDSLYRFLSGWRAMHGTALFVSALIIRIHRRAEECQGLKRVLLYQTASEMAEVISEDVGIDLSIGAIPHNELFNLFANFAAGGKDYWQLADYSVQECEGFRTYVKRQRLGASIDEAILTTAASENWNSGEYTFLSPMINTWLVDILKRPASKLRESTKYVHDHAGNTELGHFLHALNAWNLYCTATGIKAEPEQAKRVFEDYLGEIAGAFSSLDDVLAAAERGGKV